MTEKLLDPIGPRPHFDGHKPKQVIRENLNLQTSYWPIRILLLYISVFSFCVYAKVSMKSSKLPCGLQLMLYFQFTVRPLFPPFAEPFPQSPWFSILRK